MPTQAKEKKSVFETLSLVNVNEHAEVKDTGRAKLTYLSWAWAWTYLKQHYPRSFFTIYENENGWNYFTDGKTAWVKTSVTVVDDDWAQEMIEYLPVMNHRNESIKLEAITSMDVNKAIQRCLTKAAARHGLGLYIYAGEDLPNETDEQRYTREVEEAAAAKDRQDMNDLIVGIGQEIARLTKSGQPDAMTSAEKKLFAANCIVPIIGIVDYRKCTDKTKLESLIEALKVLKPEDVRPPKEK